MKKYVDGNYIDMSNEEVSIYQTEMIKPQNAELTMMEKLQIIADSIQVETPAGDTELPFKVGYKWEPIYDGSKISWRSVPDPDAIGTENNPIYYTEGVQMIDNAYYMVNGVRYVYMGGQFIEF